MKINRGEIRAVQNYGIIRLCLILAVRSTSVEIALTHSYSDLATSLDAVVEPALTEASFIVIQSDLLGIVSSARVVGSVVIRLDETIITTASDIIAGHISYHPYIWTGRPLLGEQDRRWLFKQREGRDLDSLTIQPVSLYDI